VLQALRDTDISNVRLMTMAWNTKARQMYERLGFMATGHAEPDDLMGTRDENGREIRQMLVEYAARVQNVAIDLRGTLSTDSSV
jgi:hypothetical protein